MTLRYEVEYVVDRARLADAPASLGSPEGVFDMTMSDPVKKVLGDGKARVSVSLAHKVGGPHYSSVSLSVNVSLSCGQDTDNVEEARELALAMATEFIEVNLGACYEHLTTLVGEVYK